MTPLPPGLAGSDRPLLEVHDVLLLDLDGVVYRGPHAVPGAAEALEHARRRGLRTVFVTNNASRTPQDVAEHLVELGVPASADEVVSSAQVAAAVLAQRLPAGAPVLVVGGRGLQVALREEGLTPVSSRDDAPQAVVQGFSPDLRWADLAEAAYALAGGLPWVASNLDLTIPTDQGIAPGNGSLVQAVATAVGRRPDAVAGKPSATVFEQAARRAGASAPLVVGDRLDTDLAGARNAGMPGLAVLTGLAGAGELLLAAPGLRPTLLAEDLAGLAATHPQPRVTSTGRRVEARCGTATACLDAAATDARWELAAGGSALDLLRAACSAAWASADDGGPAVDPGPVLAALRAAGADPSWAR